MQVRTLDGSLVEISAAECQKIRKTADSKDGAVHSAHATSVQAGPFHPWKAYKAAQQYKDKASHNIKRIGDLDQFPSTEQDVKDALAQILEHGTHFEFVDAIAQAAQFQAARVVMHALSHAVKQDM